MAGALYFDDDLSYREIPDYDEAYLNEVREYSINPRFTESEINKTLARSERKNYTQNISPESGKMYIKSLSTYVPISNNEIQSRYNSLQIPDIELPEEEAEIVVPEFNIPVVTNDLIELNEPVVEEEPVMDEVVPENISVQYNHGLKTAAARNNNPSNIKWNPKGFNKTLDKMGIEYEMGSNATDGGQFIKFKTLEDGLRAQIKLLEIYGKKGHTVDKGLKLWSNNGYGAEIVPLIDKNKSMSDLTVDELKQIAKAQLRIEDHKLYNYLVQNGFYK